MDGEQKNIKSEKITVERKNFFFDLKENGRGRFLRITEDVRGRRDAIIIPAPGLEEFRKALDAMIEACKDSSNATI
ncbi:PUR family DNA/RNA-binding protein [Methylacidiphilum caldifontis]|uniref:DNA-binding protein n=2 Tax=Methylacidiphilum caldifontis TaxID=2795386 RepID=A0A4Y8PCH3_9BACT|nr:PUR family DNA/RNA-binding protein [Methylacidiphilum caldifontis]QSR89089.1 PUR family DNA/RNA-binding protein [Methylacidiphilum caldifontis]TFE67478.1 DNA-binding protein [Methylacidiphilum caldifontis]